MNFISAARKIVKEFITDTKQIQLYNDILNADKAEDEKISDLLKTVNKLHHDKVMKALIKNMTMDFFSDFDDDDHQIIENFYARMLVNAEKRRKLLFPNPQDVVPSQQIPWSTTPETVVPQPPELQHLTRHLSLNMDDFNPNEFDDAFMDDTFDFLTSL
jgi:hypothetical protein